MFSELSSTSKKMVRFIQLLMRFNLCIALLLLISFFFHNIFPYFFPLVLILAISLLVQCSIGIIGYFITQPRSLFLKATLYAIASLLPLGLGVLILMGSAWGRPLRIRGRQIYPDLRKGSDWTQGPCPNAASLDPATRQALAALWLHDAQKEHASVPAFSRISWILAAIGAPADLMEWAHRAALEEIEHTRLCFALAAGYAGHSYTVEPMPDLLLSGLELKNNPFITMASESLKDGCQLEDFNADVAMACAEICEEPATRVVLQQIGEEERTHADFSWTLLSWLLEQRPDEVRKTIEKSIQELENYPRPTAVSWDKQHLVKAADPIQMLKHGRLPDERWEALWKERLITTKKRLQQLLEEKKAA